MKKLNIQLFASQNITMHSKDALSAKLAECFVTIRGNRYKFMQAINLEANFKKIKQKFLF